MPRRLLVRPPEERLEREEELRVEEPRLRLGELLRVLLLRERLLPLL